MEKGVISEYRTNRLVKIAQLLASPIFHIIFRFFLKPVVIGRDNLKKVKTPFVLAVKHSNFYDGYLLGIALGLFTPHLPLRVMSVKLFHRGYLKILNVLGIVSFFYKIFGNFIIVPGKGTDAALVDARNIIRSKNGNVVIFPEGGLFPGTIGQFRKGAVVLAKETSVPIIPISMRQSKRGRFLRKRLLIKIGAPMFVGDGTIDSETLRLQNIMSQLYH